MGRYQVNNILNQPSNSTFNSFSSTASNRNWPSVFPKESIGIDRNGVIVLDKNIKEPSDISYIPGSLEAIKIMRLKGYKVFLFFNEPLISQGMITSSDVDRCIQSMMQSFGQAGIFSIEGILYSTSNLKEDVYALPNLGMLKKAEKEFKQKFKGGFFVGNKLVDLKTAERAGSRPILIKTDNFEDAITKLDTFANRELKSKTKVFENLIEFAKSLT